MDHSLFSDLALPSLVVQTVFRHLGWTLAVAVVLARLSPKTWVRRWWWGLGLGLASNLPILTEVTSALALSFQTPACCRKACWPALCGGACARGQPEPMHLACHPY
jgi:hypothetical protein